MAVVNYKGEIAPLKTLCRKYGLCYPTIKDRIEKQGMTFEEAKEKENQHEVTYTIVDEDGNELEDTLPALCKLYEVNYSTVVKRVKKGYKLSEALMMKKERWGNNHKDETYRSFKGSRSEVCRHFDVPYNTVNYKMRVHGLTFNEAMDECLAK